MATLWRRLSIGLLLVPSTLAAGQEKTSRISLDSSGSGLANNSSVGPSISADGRFIAFSSLATNIVQSDTNGKEDIFVRDTLSGVTELISVDSANVQSDADSWATSISADGRFVAFYSKGDNLVAGDTNKFSDIFVRDRLMQTTIRVSVDSSGNEANGNCLLPSISGDGKVIAFASDATNLVAGDTNGITDEFVHDLSTGITERVSVDSSGVEGNGPSFSSGQVLSFDGRLVNFGSGATNLVPGDANAHGDVFIRDRQSGTTQICSVDSSGIQGDAGSVPSSISADGRYVIFNTFATNLVPNDTNGHLDVLLHDMQTGVTELVSSNTSGVPGNGDSVVIGSAIDDSGRFVVFMSDADDLIVGDKNGLDDVFLRDRTIGQTRRLSVDSSGQEANGDSDEPRISANGRFTAFTSLAKNLVPPDFGSWNDIFLRGPFLTLEVDPQVVLAGSTLAFSAWRGAANGGLLLAVTDVNGAPLFLPAALSSFDASGAWSYSATVPSGLAGNDISFETFGIIETGKVNVSNAVTVTFQ